jgi:hypothetical protein
MSEEDRQAIVDAELKKQRAERTLADFQAKLRAGTLGQATLCIPRLIFFNLEQILIFLEY